MLAAARWLALATDVASAAACRRAPPLASATLALAVHTDVTGIFPNPPIQNETYTTFVNRNIFEGLVGFDRQLRIEPGLAARWESLDDRTTICHLRPGVYLFGWACGSGEAGDTLDALFRSPAAGAGGTYNTFGVVDPELDRLIDDSNQKSGAERAVRLRTAISRVHQLRPLLPLLVQREAMAVSRRVEWDPPLNLAIRLEDIRAAR